MSKNKKKWMIILCIIVFIILLSSFIYVGFKLTRKDTTKVNENFIINDTLQTGNGEKVKVLLLAGQSNASGVSSVEFLKQNISENKFEQYTQGYENVYINYYNDNGHNKSLGFVPVGLHQGYKIGYFGPELSMGEKLSELYPNEKIFIIKYAWGGSNLHTQWNSDYGNIYKAFIKFAKESMQYLKSKNYDAEIVSMMWMQGESDADAKNSKKYEYNLKKMILSIRKELENVIHQKGMYFVDAYIKDSSYWKEYKTVNNAKQKVCDSSPLNLCVDTLKEGLTVNKEPINNPDLAHYDSLSEIKLGYLFIEIFYQYFSI